MLSGAMVLLPMVAVTDVPVHCWASILQRIFFKYRHTHLMVNMTDMHRMGWCLTQSIMCMLCVVSQRYV